MTESEKTPVYCKFLERYDGRSDNELMKAALTDVGFELSRKIWEQLPSPKGRGTCTFCIGGINSITPFSSKSAKNEILVYAQHVAEDAPKIDPQEMTLYDKHGKELSEQDLTHFLSVYDEIYMDFNGSMAFFQKEWKECLSDPSIIRKVDQSF